jgi:hypothetical protein
MQVWPSNQEDEEDDRQWMLHFTERCVRPGAALVESTGQGGV